MDQLGLIVDDSTAETDWHVQVRVRVVKNGAVRRVHDLTNYLSESVQYEDRRAVRIRGDVVLTSIGLIQNKMKINNKEILIHSDEDNPHISSIDDNETYLSEDQVTSVIIDE